MRGRRRAGGTGGVHDHAHSEHVDSDRAHSEYVDSDRAHSEYVDTGGG
jgi:hypothetical protein